MSIYLIGMLLSFVAYLILGFFISKKVKGADDFYVAGRNAPTLLIVGSMIASYLSTGFFMGEAGEYYAGIFTPMIILSIMSAGGYLIGSAFFGKYLRRSKVYSIPEFFGKRFDSGKVRTLATIIALITMTVYLLSVMQGIGTLMSVVTDMDYNLCLALAAIVFAGVSVLSGSRGVLITDTIMFSVFTIAMLIAAVFIVKGGGGWLEVVSQLKNHDVSGLLSWTGNLDYMYNSGIQNLVWALIYGVVWFSVCMVGPWQSSRYLMAKNEHTVIRSSVFISLGTFLLVFVVGLCSTAIRIYNPELSSNSHVLIWAAINIMPTFVGVILLTGVLAAGVSSATTFLSLIGTSVAKDIYKKEDNSIRVSRISMLIISVVVLLLGVTNPPQIFWIMYLGGAIIASAWMPTVFLSVLWKRSTKNGIFAGMLIGFVSCFSLKLYSNLMSVTFSPYLDPVVIGIALNFLVAVVVSLLDKNTENEQKSFADLFIVPEEEKNPEDIKKTLKIMKWSPAIGLIICLIMILVWALPYLFVN